MSHMMMVMHPPDCHGQTLSVDRSCQKRLHSFFGILMFADQKIYPPVAATDRSKVGDLKRLVEDLWAVPRICRHLRWVPFVDLRSLMN